MPPTPFDEAAQTAALTSHFLEHLPRPDRYALLVALAWLTRLDERVTESERAFLRQLGEQLALQREEIDEAFALSAGIDDPRTAIQAISSDWVRELLLQQLVAAAFCDGAYDARERRGIRTLASAAAIPFEAVERWEQAFARGLFERMEHEEELLATTQEILAKREARRSFSFKRLAQIAAGGLIGGGAVVLSGGATAPALLAALGASGAVAVAGGLASLGGEELPTATVGVGPFGEGAGVVASQLFGADSAPERFAERAAAAGLQKTQLTHLGDHSGHLVIGVGGYCRQPDDLAAAWRVLEQVYPHSERYALRWEADRLAALGAALKERPSAGEPLRAIEDHARRTGAVLAELLRDGWLGRRPLSLLGFSSGTVVILEALRRMGADACRVSVDSVVLLGGTSSADDPLLCGLVTQIGGTLFNAYCAADRALGSMGGDPVGLRAICEDDATQRVRNLHLEGLAGDHLAYGEQLGAILEQARAHGA